MSDVVFTGNQGEGLVWVGGGGGCRRWAEGSDLLLGSSESRLRGMDEDCEPLLPPHRSAGLSGEARNRFRGSLMLDIFPEATFKQFFS